MVAHVVHSGFVEGLQLHGAAFVGFVGCDLFAAHEVVEVAFPECGVVALLIKLEEV